MRQSCLKYSVGIWSIVALTAVVFTLFVSIHRMEARPQKAAGTVTVSADSIGGVVSSSKGVEAGVWVVAETTDLPTKFRKIVVTDDQGRYLLPELPKAKYQVWVRGYGLVDSQHVQASPGQTLALTAVIAPDARAAAQYYPADYWYSLAQVPDKSEFPGTGPQGNGINPRMKTQADWVWQMKSGCETCHQIGDKATRELEPQLGTFPTSVAAWDHRTRVGQDGAGMSGSIGNYGRDRGLGMLADWTDRIAKGELPPVPPRPQGIERNVVLTEWEWGAEATFAHDEISTDKHHPTSNANGPIYGVDWGNDDFLIVDPVEHTASRMRLPLREEGVPAGKSQKMLEPSPYWGSELYWNDPAIPNHLAIDSKGRIWMSARFRKPENQPEFCKQGNQYAQLQPLETNFRELEYYDPKTRKFSFVDVCFDSHHVQIGTDPDETIYSNGPFGGTVNWLKIKVLDETGDVQKAEGWCGAYIDVNGDGKFEPDVDVRLNLRGIYGIAASPVDHAPWGALPGVPGKIFRVDQSTCATEVYEPPFNNPNAPGKSGFGPRGIDFDTNGVVWTALAGSGQMASFDRRKCKVFTGKEATDGQHCVEGWTLYPIPGPRFKGVTDEINADYHYYNWVDQFDTFGLGKNVPLANGTGSDSLLAMLPDGKFVTLRVPYPMGFYQRGMDGRIDNPNTGWKGRGLYADYGPNAIWHIEGGKGSKSSLVKFQLRPNPLAD
jgi:hypothetical protein